MTIRFAFHPVTGQRLVRTINAAITFHAARIEQIDGAAVVEGVVAEPYDGNQATRASLFDSPFVATAAGDSCLLREALWSDQDVDQIEPPSSALPPTQLPSLNSVLTDLVHVGEAAQQVFDNWERGDLASAVSGLQDSVTGSALLRAYLDLEGNA